MCMQCVGAVGSALQAATVIGGPFAYAGYRRARAALGLKDTSVAAQQAAQAAPVGFCDSAPTLTSRSITETTSGENCVPEQRRNSASASPIASGSW